MAAKDNGVRMSRHGGLESAHQHVVGFTCEGCAATLPVDSTTYEDILDNGCVVCGVAADAPWFGSLMAASTSGSNVKPTGRSLTWSSMAKVSRSKPSDSG